MTRINKYILVGMLSMGVVTSTLASSLQGYLTEEEYNNLEQGIIREDRGIVLENYPKLGYMVYRNEIGEEITAYYYSSEMTVEKAPYYEQEDKVGYMDELFPTFDFDPRDTTISAIQPGDNIYLRTDQEGYVTYISAYNDYTIRYGKVHTWTLGADSMNTLVVEDQSGRLYNYKIPMNIPITKAGNTYSLGHLQEGEWVRLLVNQKILGYGNVEESVLEIVVDPDSRVISDIKVGELVGVNVYQNTISLQNSQTLLNSGWSPYQDIESIRINPRTLQAYYGGNPIGYEYIRSRLLGTGGYVYAAVESYMGKEEAIKLNFQTKKQTTLEPSTIIYASPGVVELMSGEKLFIADDSIVVRGDRLVGPASLMTGDVIQAVITGENKLAVGNVMEHTGLGTLEIFRGRIKKIQDQQYFEVETFSMLSDGEWYFHPVSRSFAIDGDTKLVTEEGIISGGINEFLDYGENAQIDQVYTVIARGDRAELINAIPYTREGAKGYVYSSEEGEVKIRDLMIYDEENNKWEQPKGGYTGGTVTTEVNTIVIKEGELVPVEALEIGDQVMVMMVEDVYEVNPQDAEGQTMMALNAHIIIVE